MRKKEKIEKNGNNCTCGVPQLSAQVQANLTESYVDDILCGTTLNDLSNESKTYICPQFNP